jgi:hypothetical protein
MKILHCSWKHARGCLLLFILINLGVSNAFCRPSLGGAIRAIKDRVEHTIHKIRKVADEESSSPRSRQDERTVSESDIDQRYLPEREQQRRPAPALPQSPVNSVDDTVNIRERNISAKASATPAAKAGKSAGQPAPESAEKTATSKGARESTTKQEAVPPPSTPPSKLGYARPVPGHPGFVYAPGDSAELKNMLDVRGCAPGRTMLDPRSGKKFLVP